MIQIRPQNTFPERNCDPDDLFYASGDLWRVFGTFRDFYFFLHIFRLFPPPGPPNFLLQTSQIPPHMIQIHHKNTFPERNFDSDDLFYASGDLWCVFGTFRKFSKISKIFYFFHLPDLSFFTEICILGHFRTSVFVTFFNFRRL